MFFETVVMRQLLAPSCSPRQGGSRGKRSENVRSRVVVPADTVQWCTLSVHINKQTEEEGREEGREGGMEGGVTHEISHVRVLSTEPHPCAEAFLKRIISQSTPQKVQGQV